MKDTVYQLVNYTGVSATSIEDAVGEAIKRAHRSYKRIHWFEVTETRGSLDKGRINLWQVTVRVGVTPRS
ncbi:MAG TPA: dodecin family protein [Opitutaceae bacterium]|nr:dodecin family protein [Opitutaceae bacterium]